MSAGIVILLVLLLFSWLIGAVWVIDHAETHDPQNVGKWKMIVWFGGFAGIFYYLYKAGEEERENAYDKR